jgi:hypothetical protein
VNAAESEVEQIRSYLGAGVLTVISVRD